MSALSQQSAGFHGGLAILATVAFFSFSEFVELILSALYIDTFMLHTRRSPYLHTHTFIQHRIVYHTFIVKRQLR